MHSLLRDCYRIEDLASKIYLHLSKNNTYPEKIRKVFAQLSVDEKNHAGNLDLLMQVGKQDPDAAYSVSWDKINQALKFAEKAILMAEKGCLDEVQALTMAVEMEELFVKAHAQNVLEFKNPKLVDLFKELGKEDRSHVARLNDCLSWWHSERKPLYYAEK